MSGAHQPTAVAIRDDRLTGLFTLPYLEELLKRDWSVAQREKRSIAVFAIDIDALDLYNTTFGRAAGDSTIRRVAHVVSGCLRRSSDVTARIDGGSLIAFAPGLTTEQALRIGQLMAERVRDLRIHHPRSAVLRYVSVSVGVCAAVPDPADSPAGLVEKSQKQLQIAKKVGAQSGGVRLSPRPGAGNSCRAAGLASRANSRTARHHGVKDTGDFMQFTRAIVRPPAGTFAAGLSSAAEGPPDLDKALEQHAHYVQALRDCGLEVTSLEPDDAYPDSTFVEDTAIMTERGAIVMRPGAPSREGEVASMGGACEISIRSCPPSTLRAPWTAAISAKRTDIFSSACRRAPMSTARINWSGTCIGGDTLRASSTSGAMRRCCI